MGNTKWVHLMFAAGGLVLAYLLVKTTEWVWGYFAKPQDFYVLTIGLVGATVLTVIGWRNKNLFTKGQEILTELMKVTWPTRKETSAATVVVIVTVIIFSFVLGIFDMVWSWATGMIYT